MPAWVKSAVRNALWRLRARRVPAPVLASDSQSVLFVCKGNVCRSPFAEALARQIAPGDRPWTFGSAGTAPSRERVCPENAVAVASTYGLDLRSHRAGPLDAYLAQSYDLLVVMDYEQYTLLCDRWPHLKPRIVLLSLFDAPAGTSARDRLNITDPWGQDRDTFAACYARVDRAVNGMLRQLAARAGAADASR